MNSGAAVPVRLADCAVERFVGQGDGAKASGGVTGPWYSFSKRHGQGRSATETTFTL